MRGDITCQEDARLEIYLGIMNFFLNIDKFKNADNYGCTNISLPVYPKLKMTEIDKICKTIIGLI